MMTYMILFWSHGNTRHVVYVTATLGHTRWTSVCVTWMTWLIHDATHPWRDSSMTWLIHDSFMWINDVTHPRLIHVWHEWRDSFMTHSCIGNLWVIRVGLVIHVAATVGHTRTSLSRTSLSVNKSMSLENKSLCEQEQVSLWTREQVSLWTSLTSATLGHTRDLFTHSRDSFTHKRDLFRRREHTPETIPLNSQICGWACVDVHGGCGWVWMCVGVHTSTDYNTYNPLEEYDPSRFDSVTPTDLVSSSSARGLWRICPGFGLRLFGLHCASSIFSCFFLLLLSFLAAFWLMLLLLLHKK